MNMSYPSRAKRDSKQGAKTGEGSSTGKKTIRISQRSPEELELASRLLEKIKDLPNVRQDLCEQIKHQIAEGTYETTERLETAAEQLVEEILQDGGLEITEGPDPTE